MTNHKPENVSKSFKCGKCGTMFEVADFNSHQCPVCKNICSTDNCSVLDSSDEGY